MALPGTTRRMSSSSGRDASGLHAAVRARDLGASVLVIEQNFDVGGKLVHSGGWTSLGGGDAIQERDRTGADPQRHGADRAASQAGRPGRRSRPSVQGHDRLVGGRCHRRRPLSLQRSRAASRLGRQRAQDPAVHDGQLRPLRADRRHPSGRRHDARPRGPGHHEDRRQDRHQGGHGIARGPRRSAKASGIRRSIRCASFPARRPTILARPAGSMAVSPSRGRWNSAPARRASSSCSTATWTSSSASMPFSGRVVGVKASYTPRTHPETGARLESFWQQRQYRRARQDDPHPRAQGRDRRHRRHAGQRAAADHDRSAHGRAVDRVRAERADGAAQHGRQRDQSPA